jgi:hypothetical protein
MFKQPQKLILFCAVYLAASVFLLTCGIEEYYYLPQVPEVNINTIFNTDATIILPSLTGYYYARYYLIYYRIYISGNYETGTINTSSLRSAISTTLDNDFNAIYPNTDPTSTSAGIPAETLFKGRNYYQMAFYKNGKIENISSLLPISGGNVKIFFPTTRGESPVISINDDLEFPLYRSEELTSPEPTNNIYFLNSSDLNASEKATSDINADVAAPSGLSQRYAYVSMYIVAVGINTATFTLIYSKPTHISVFRLPDN